MFKAIWMSDLHFAKDGDVLGHDPRVRLRRAIAQINTHHGDAGLCVISGDLVNRGMAEDYHALRQELDALQIPYAPMMGNHDNRGLLRDALPLPKGGMPDFIQYGVETPEGLILCLDTHREGSDAGEFCAARANWLGRTLTEAGDRPVFLFLHHPPMALGLPMQDSDRMGDGDQFLDLISAFPTVRSLFIGHVHRPITGTIRGIPFSTMRSVLYQAPPPRPDWDWSSFTPAREAPNIGILSFAGGDVALQYDQFCDAGLGVLIP